MTRKEFRKLKIGDMVSHRDLEGIVLVNWVSREFDYSTNPATRFTSAITVDCGRYMKLIDTSDVVMLQLADAQLPLL